MGKEPHDEPLLTDEEAAELLSIKKGTLRIWRLRGFGPPFIKLRQSVRYERKTLREWIASRAFQSTTEVLG